MADQPWAALLDELRHDRRSGATALASRAARGLQALAEGLDDGQAGLIGLRPRLQELATVRPPIAPLFRLANEAAQAIGSGLAGVEIRDLLRELGSGLADELDREHDETVNRCGQLFSAGHRALTLSSSSVVVDAIGHARSVGARLVVTCLESRPGGEGVRAASALATHAGVAVRLAPDSAAARLMEETDLVLLGGDTLSPTGLIHKIGTLGLALAARERGVPIYALLGSSKLLPAPVRGWESDGAPNDEVPAEPLPNMPDSQPTAGSLQVWNRNFDLTPLDLLAGVVSEQGLLSPEDVASQAAAQPIHPWLEGLLENRGSETA